MLPIGSVIWLILSIPLDFTMGKINPVGDRVKNILHYDWVFLQVLHTGIDGRADVRLTYFSSSIISDNSECHLMTNMF